MMDDLLLRAGRVICPASGRDGPGSIAIRGDRIVAVGDDLPNTANQTLEFPEAIILPGLIDLHAHPARTGSQFGIDADQYQLARGTTTTLSQGDAGAGNCEQFLRDTVEGSRTEVLLALNLSRRGESGPGGCFSDFHLADVSACVIAAQRFTPHIWGIAVNTSHHACGTTEPKEVLRRGLIAAEQTGLPLLYGLRRPEDWPLDEQLQLLRPGDVVTYCFRCTPHCIVQDGRVLDCLLEARSRGVLFDVGHGTNSFDFETAEMAIGQGFAPDTISTDLQRAHLDQSPTLDLPLVMSKLRAAGMAEPDVFRAVTWRPAQILSRELEIGTLAVGSRADLAVLKWLETGEPLTDARGQQRMGGRWVSVATVRNGVVV